MLHPAAVFDWFFKMGTSLESVNALKSRALEVALSAAEANALETNGITSLARLAFAAWHPGQTPTEAQLQPLLQPIPLNPGNTASLLKRLIFEPQRLVCNEVKLKANRKDDAAHTTFAGPERDARVQQQKDRLTGLRFSGEKKSVAIRHMTSLSRCWKKTASFILDQKSFQQDATNSCRRNPARRCQFTSHNSSSKINSQT